MRINTLFHLIHEGFEDDETRVKLYSLVRAIIATYKSVEGMKNSVLDLFTYQDEICNKLSERFPDAPSDLELLFDMDDVFEYLCSQGAISDAADSDEDYIESDVGSDDDDDDDTYEITSNDDKEPASEIRVIYFQPRMLFVNTLLAVNTIMTIGIFYKSFSREFNLMFNA